MALPPAAGLSVAMLAKLLVAGIGMAYFLRVLGTNGPAAAFGGVAFASSSFMADWLAWPIASVAAFTPWLFSFIELYLKRRQLWALPAIAIVIALQFFGGHAETSFHLALGAGIYALVRWVGTGRSFPALIGLAAAVITGTLLAAVQLAPFIDLLRTVSLVGIRASAGYGHAHLNIAAIASWVFPNAVGNPGIDGVAGRPPDFNESTGFAGVAALVLAPIGIWSGWNRMRSAVIALVAVAVASAGAVYGLLTPVAASLLVFKSRTTSAWCFCSASAWLLWARLASTG
jgi:hypothetical protein